MSYESFQDPRANGQDIDQGGSAAYEDAYQRANYRATYGGDVEANYRAGTQQQTQSGGQWRATYGSDVEKNFRAGTPSEETGGRYRATYGSDVANNFRPGIASESTGPYRATYGSDVANNFRPGVQYEGSGPYRATYGSDVANNFQAGQQSEYAGTSDPYRATDGGDVGQTYLLSQQPEGENVWQNFNPQTQNYITGNDVYSGSQYANSDFYRDPSSNIWQLDAPFARAANAAQQEQFMRTHNHSTENGQAYIYDQYGQPVAYRNDSNSSHEHSARNQFVDPRQEYFQQMMMMRIASMIQNQGGTVNLYYNGQMQSTWNGTARPRMPVNIRL
ncbi:MAG: hypothetical protein IAF58_14395 [Leptolyngbya sp.]|nr:hypothetical protein [Candidatus Melainabacteria bacterium]